ncbi:hypothetical protein [Gynuella sunshinyii]|uniref:hypothetical protein n=1 Tax=Gynuella sunshinyii TaxID=1445505 RepID=UPI0011870795
MAFKQGNLLCLLRQIAHGIFYRHFPAKAQHPEPQSIFTADNSFCHNHQFHTGDALVASGRTKNFAFIFCEDRAGRRFPADQPPGKHIRKRC